MFPDFLPRDVELLKNDDSIKLVKSIKRQPILTPRSRKEIYTAYVSLGTGSQPILLLHGFDSSLLEFRRLIPLLASVTETWAVDLLGSGFTERSPYISYNPDTIQEHLYCFWRTAIQRPVILVGISMGGATAIDFTLTHPEAVAKLILVNSVGYSGSFEIGRLLPKPVIEMGVEFWRARRALSLYWSQLGLLDSETEDVIRCAALPSLMPGWKEAIDDFTRSGGYYRLKEGISSIDKPTLIVWGERDEVLGTQAAYQFQTAIANSKLVWLPGGHSLQWEQPKLLATQILQFIAL